ncbi:MAG: hypothetical protein NC394_08830 [Bacteroides sp.]|nr:hypothetical protein [Bacteroides sp.]
MFKCTLCGRIWEPHECRVTYNEKLCETYIGCPECKGECVDFDEEEDRYGVVI